MHRQIPQSQVHKNPCISIPSVQHSHHNNPLSSNPTSTSIQFPSFGPSLQTSPSKNQLFAQQSSTYQSTSSNSQDQPPSQVQSESQDGVYRISIHLPQQFLDCNSATGGTATYNSQAQDNKKNSNSSPPMQPSSIVTTVTKQLLPSTSSAMLGTNSVLSPSNGGSDINNSNPNSNIRVYCRLRQPRPSSYSSSCVRYDTTMLDDGDNCYSFDHIFGKYSTQIDLYDRIADRHINDFFLGKNSTIFAYGQTGSGKTYTMFGSMNQPQNYGIIPRILQQIFKRDLSNSTISCSMLQIYNEKLMDLFNPLTNSNCQIKLKQFNDQIFLDGLQEILVQNQHQLLSLIKMGHKGRKIAATQNNDVSSRSHTILFLYRNFQCRGQDFRTKLCFIDLAGSQKIRKSGVKGQTLEETKKINLSLSCLGNVIHSLTNGSDHIPYRNSKLTRILKDSLSTDTSTSIITTCSLDQNDYQETISTIKFAVRAKRIKNKKKLDYQEETTLQQQYIKLKKQLQETKKELEHYKRRQVETQQKQKMSSSISFTNSILPITTSLSVNSSTNSFAGLSRTTEQRSRQNQKQNHETDIPEERQRALQPIRSICVISHGVSSRIKLNSPSSLNFNCGSGNQSGTSLNGNGLTFCRQLSQKNS